MRLAGQFFPANFFGHRKVSFVKQVIIFLLLISGCAVFSDEVIPPKPTLFAGKSHHATAFSVTSLEAKKNKKPDESPRAEV